MLRLLLTLLFLLIVALGVVWLAELDGRLLIALPGYEVEVPLLTGVILLALSLVTLGLLWKLIATVFDLPAKAGRALRMRKRRNAREAISTGLIAAEAGETAKAMSLAVKADRLSNDKSLVRLLEARAALSSGNERRAAEVYKEMLKSPKTRLLGLKGLYELALKEARIEEAEELATQARAISREALWAADGVLQAQTLSGDWDEALKTVQMMADDRLLERARARRYRAVLLTAKAQGLTASQSDEAYKAAREAHALAPDLPPAALKLAEIYMLRDDERRARKTLETAFLASPHPDLADAFINIRLGEGVEDRFKRAEKLLARAGENREARLAFAGAAIDAARFDKAREALIAVLQSQPTARAYNLMAELEEADGGNVGKAREWLSRAVNAPRDPEWMADGLVSEAWAPVGPISGKLDAYEWRTPMTSLAPQPSLSLAELEAISAPSVKEVRETSASQEEPAAKIVEAEVVEPQAKAEAKPEKPKAEPKAEKGNGEAKPTPKPEVKAEEAPKEAAKKPQATSDDTITLPRQPDDPGLMDEDEPTPTLAPDVPRTH